MVHRYPNQQSLYSILKTLELFHPIGHFLQFIPKSINIWYLRHSSSLLLTQSTKPPSESMAAVARFYYASFFFLIFIYFSGWICYLDSLNSYEFIYMYLYFIFLSVRYVLFLLIKALKKKRKQNRWKLVSPSSIVSAWSRYYVRDETMRISSVVLVASIAFSLLREN